MPSQCPALCCPLAPRLLWVVSLSVPLLSPSRLATCNHKIRPSPWSDSLHYQVVHVAMLPLDTDTGPCPINRTHPLLIGLQNKPGSHDGLACSESLHSQTCLLPNRWTLPTASHLQFTPLSQRFHYFAQCIGQKCLHWSICWCRHENGVAVHSAWHMLDGLCWCWATVTIWWVQNNYIPCTADWSF